jgi:hypothetical protein
MTRLVALYPRPWRDRYEAEFLALMDDRPPDALDRVDIVRGAIDARLRPRLDGDPGRQLEEPVPYNGPWSATKAGALALIGGFLWLATVVIAINGPLVTESGDTYRDGSAALPVYFTSLILLGVGIWAVAATLPSTARVARTAALVGGVAGLLWAFGPWILWAGFLTCGGVAIVAIGAARTGRWRRSDAGLLVTAVVAAWGSLFVLASAPGDAVGSDAGYLVCFLLLAPMWFATADALLRPARPIAQRADALRPS